MLHAASSKCTQSVQPIVSASVFYDLFRHRVQRGDLGVVHTRRILSIGQAFQSKYQVVGKLEYGAYATVSYVEARVGWEQSL
jgi:hypothetical protein